MKIKLNSCAWSWPYKKTFLANIEVNIFLSFVGHISSEISSSNTMPNSFVSFLESALHVWSCWQWFWIIANIWISLNDAHESFRGKKQVNCKANLHLTFKSNSNKKMSLQNVLETVFAVLEMKSFSKRCLLSKWWDTWMNSCSS